MGFLLIIIGLLIGYKGYQETNNTLYVLAVIAVAIGAVLETVDTVLSHKRKMARIEKGQDQDDAE